MKLSTAALSLLLLAGVLGAQAFVLHDTETKRLALAVDRFDRGPVQGVNRMQQIMPLSSNVHPSDCCFSYTQQNIRCSIMEDFFETSSQCSMPGVIFITKCGRRVCANPMDSKVKDCMKIVKAQGTRPSPRAVAGLLY